MRIGSIHRFINTMAVKRAVADAKELQSTLYKDSGIFYAIEDSNVLLGRACIFGPKDTPYEDCPMLYNFELPNTFPFEPPKVTFLTCDGQTRFHPNMYKEGKVCLSILGTWQGEKWSSVMRLSTILVVLQSIMDTNPLKHEPGYAATNTDTHTLYAKYVEYKCICYILQCIEQYYNHQTFCIELAPFKTEMIDRIPRTLERLETRLRRLVEAGNLLSVGLPYGLSDTISYAQCLERVVKLKALQIPAHE
jgi:ubiquitin-protein ligase